MKKRRNAAFGALFLLLASVLFSSDVSAEAPLRITKEELKQRLGNPEIVIVDVRGRGGVPRRGSTYCLTLPGCLGELSEESAST